MLDPAVIEAAARVGRSRLHISSFQGYQAQWQDRAGWDGHAARGTSIMHSEGRTANGVKSNALSYTLFLVKKRDDGRPLFSYYLAIPWRRKCLTANAAAVADGPWNSHWPGVFQTEVACP